MVYDEYFPIGSAPTSECEMHGAAAGLTGLGGDSGEGVTAVGTSGLTSASVMPASYGASGSSATGSHLQKMIGPDGRAVWVVK